MNKRYAATLATLYPDMVPDEAKAKARASDKATGRKGDEAAERRAEVAQHANAEESAADDLEFAPTPAPAAAASPVAPPRDAAEAEQRFFTRYGEIIGGDNWANVQSYLRSRAPKPTTVEGWIAAAEAVRDRSRGEGSPAMAA